MNTALAFCAHPDDAEILCGGTLIRLAEKGWKIHIATATPGDCGTMLHNRFDISSIRTQEATSRTLAGERAIEAAERLDPDEVAQDEHVKRDLQAQL